MRATSVQNNLGYGRSLQGGGFSQACLGSVEGILRARPRLESRRFVNDGRGVSFVGLRRPRCAVSDKPVQTQGRLF